MPMLKLFHLEALSKTEQRIIFWSNYLALTMSLQALYNLWRHQVCALGEAISYTL